MLNERGEAPGEKQKQAVTAQNAQRVQQRIRDIYTAVVHSQRQAQEQLAGFDPKAKSQRLPENMPRTKAEDPADAKTKGQRQQDIGDNFAQEEIGGIDAEIAAVIKGDQVDP